MVAWRLRSESEGPVSRLQAERYSQAEAVTRALVERFGVRRVMWLGSLVRGAAEGDGEVALWVEGLPEEACVAAAELVREGITAAPVELLRAEWAAPSVRERAMRHGVVLHAS